MAVKTQNKKRTQQVFVRTQFSAGESPLMVFLYWILLTRVTSRQKEDKVKRLEEMKVEAKRTFSH